MGGGFFVYTFLTRKQIDLVLFRSDIPCMDTSYITSSRSFPVSHWLTVARPLWDGECDVLVTARATVENRRVYLSNVSAPLPLSPTELSQAEDALCEVARFV